MPTSEKTSRAGGPVLASGEQARSSGTRGLLLTMYSDVSECVIMNTDCFLEERLFLFTIKRGGTHVLTL